jgi:hypothetical protein
MDWHSIRQPAFAQGGEGGEVIGSILIGYFNKLLVCIFLFYTHFIIFG